MKTPIVILHGWGASSQTFQEVKMLLEKEGYSVEVPDLPGFGGAPLVKDPMKFDNYVAFVKRIIGDRQVVLLAHSFGARVAIAYAAQYPASVKKLIITGASGIPHPLSLRQRLATYAAKGGKVMLSVPVVGSFAQKLIYVWIGEWDYYNAGALRDTFKNVYQFDIRPFLSKISCPTLIVWGERDKTTQLEDGEFMKQHIKGSKLLVIKGGTHEMPYKMPHVFVEKILPFLTQ